MSYVIPHHFPAEPGPTSTNGFTLGKKYSVLERCNSTVTVLNDNGHERVIIPGANSPHIVYQSGGGKLGYLLSSQRCVGYFSEYFDD